MMMRLSLLLFVVQWSSVIVVVQALANNNLNWKNTLDQVTTSGVNFLTNKQVPVVDEELARKQQGYDLLEKIELTSNIEPKPFSVDLNNLPNILFASVPALLRLGTGTLAEGYSLELADRNTKLYSILPQLPNNKQLAEVSNGDSTRAINLPRPLVLYDREGSVACRKIREACSILSLQVTIRPCPVNGLQFVSKLSNRNKELLKQLPILQDPNTGIELANENKDADVEPILSYLFKTYGNGEIPWTLANNPFASITTALAMLSRFGIGSRYQTSDPPPLPITLWSYESCPFCKVVTETLGKYELEHTVIYCPRGSPNRDKMLSDPYIGRFQVPYLQDPNTGVELWESSAICEYLDKQYGARTPVAYV